MICIDIWYTGTLVLIVRYRSHGSSYHIFLTVPVRYHLYGPAALEVAHRPVCDQLQLQRLRLTLLKISCYCESRSRLDTGKHEFAIAISNDYDRLLKHMIGMCRCELWYGTFDMTWKLGWICMFNWGVGTSIGQHDDVMMLMPIHLPPGQMHAG